MCSFYHVEHEGHEKVKLDNNSLMEEFGLERDISLKVYAEILKDINKRFELHPVMKMISAMKDRLKPVARILDSFGVNRIDVYRWAEKLIKEGNNEILNLLWGVRRIKDMN